MEYYRHPQGDKHVMLLVIHSKMELTDFFFFKKKKPMFVVKFSRCAEHFPLCQGYITS